MDGSAVELELDAGLGLDFERAAELVLSHLCAVAPMDFWSVTRVVDGRQSYLYLGDNAYGLQRGGSHDWEDSFCVHMADAVAPAVVPDVRQVPVYVEAARRLGLPIGAYAGARIDEADGSLFGAICGLRRTPVAPGDGRLDDLEPLLVLLGRLLTMVLRADRARSRAESARLQAELAAETDALTGLSNRRAWDRVLAEERTRWLRFGDPTVLVAVDLDRVKEVNDAHGHAAGDAHIATAARALLEAVREVDVVARLGGDEFGVLLRRTPAGAAPGAVQRLQEQLDGAGVPASAGWASVQAAGGFAEALAAADAEMYRDKRSRQESRTR